MESIYLNRFGMDDEHAMPAETPVIRNLVAD